jgi:hypothetical protein
LIGRRKLPGKSWLCLAAGVAILLAGCGQPAELGQVQGTVRVGGQPLANVLVTFIPQGEHAGGMVRSMGTTDEKGQFSLRTETLEDGAQIGNHSVIVEDLAIYAAPRDDDGTVTQVPPARFGPSYSDPLLSPLRREVKAGTQQIDLDLDPG